MFTVGGAKFTVGGAMFTVGEAEFTERGAVFTVGESLFTVGGAHKWGCGTPLMVPVMIFWRAFIFVSNDFSKKKTGPKIGRSLSL